MEQLAYATPAFADAEALETLRTECGTQLNLPPSGCDCIVAGAAKFNDNQLALVTAAVTEDDAAVAALRAQMSLEDMTKAATFMTQAPQSCAPGG